jgi:ASC-1-like (ASCH) protein
MSLNIFSKLTPEGEERIQKYFNELSYEKTNFEPDGTVCERVSVREVESIYPKENFEIINGIQYDDKKKTIGELDLVIFEKSTGLVHAIAEVKCWKSFKGALKKAKEQRMRFQTYLNRGIILTDENGKQYSKDLFRSIQKYFSISQDGGLNQGFDFELSLDLKELIELRGRLLDCHAQGRCPKK